jgi:hypothetical protein
MQGLASELGALVRAEDGVARAVEMINQRLGYLTVDHSSVADGVTVH